jgi:hypothetical protein
MSWESARPQDTWKPEGRETFKFLREIYTRFRCFGSFTWNPPSVPAASTVDTTLTTADSAVFEGLRAGQAVTVTPPSTLDSGVVWGGAWVADDNTLTIRLGNVTALAINPVSATWVLHGMVT